MSKRPVEKQVKEFYDSRGWVVDERDKPLEDRLFRDLKGGRGDYDHKVRLQASELLKSVSGDLLIVGCGDLPRSHQLAASTFERVICLDISSRALAVSRDKLQQAGEYIEASALGIPLEDNSVDAILCSHMLYHIDRHQQRLAVREMIRVTRSGGTILVLYTNPNAPLMLIQRGLKALRINKLLGKAPLYFHAHAAAWWQQFSGSCRIRILPSIAITTNQARALLPAARLRRRFYDWASRFEDRHQTLASRLWSHVAIVLEKRD